MPRILLALLALAPLAGQALDLTPARSFRELEGIKIPVIRFADGAQTAVFQPPAGWSVTGGAELLNLYPTDRVDVLAQIRVEAVKPGDAGAAENLETWCRQYLPKDATKTGYSGETPSPFTLHALPSREFTYTFASQGRRFVSSVAVVELTQHERLSVVITARESDFKLARQAVIRSLFTMNWSE